jgi:alpha-beta hydrolase superfamily lysophospholipase
LQSSRGHGKTAKSLEDIGYLTDKNGRNLAVKDIHKLTNIIKEEQHGLPVFLFGHSVESLLLRDYISLCRKDINRICL